MPALAQVICRYPGCGQRIDGHDRYCLSHARASADQKATPWGTHHTKRIITGPALQEERRRLFERQPLCVECEKQGRVTLAVIRDHIIPLSQGGPDTESNTQGLCRACHDLKSEAERKQGFNRMHQDYRDRMQNIERNRDFGASEECLA